MFWAIQAAILGKNEKVQFWGSTRHARSSRRHFRKQQGQARPKMATRAFFRDAEFYNILHNFALSPFDHLLMATLKL